MRSMSCERCISLSSTPADASVDEPSSWLRLANAAGTTCASVGVGVIVGVGEGETVGRACDCMVAVADAAGAAAEAEV